MWGYGNLVDAVYSNNGTILSEDGTKVTINSPEWVEVWDAFRAWIQEGVVELADFASGMNGVSTSHTVHFVGPRTLGTLTVTEDSATFEKDADDLGL